MLGRIVPRALMVLMVCGLPTILHASDAQQKILTQSDVERVLKVFPGYVQWIKGLAPGFKVEGKERNPSIWLVVGMFQKGAADYIQSQGWNFQDFTLAAGSLFLAYSRLESELVTKADLKLKKDDSQKQTPVQQTKPASPEDQALQGSSVRQGTGAPPEVPKTNLEIVRKNRELIRAMLSTIW
jgi:hypothetical protein